MKICLNTNCSHRKITGKPAGFVDGIESCSDCGNLLSTFTEKESNKIKINKAFYTKIFISLGLVFIWKIMSYIPAPGTL